MIHGWRESDASPAPIRMGSPWLAAVVLGIASSLVYWLVVIYPKG